METSKDCALNGNFRRKVRNLNVIFIEDRRIQVRVGIEKLILFFSTNLANSQQDMAAIHFWSADLIALIAFIDNGFCFF